MQSSGSACDRLTLVWSEGKFRLVNISWTSSSPVAFYNNSVLIFPALRGLCFHCCTLVTLLNTSLYFWMQSTLPMFNPALQWYKVKYPFNTWQKQSAVALGRRRVLILVYFTSEISAHKNCFLLNPHTCMCLYRKSLVETCLGDLAVTPSWSAVPT